MKLYIKNMVCNRCIMVVQQHLREAGLSYKEVRLGEVTVDEQPQNEQLQVLRDKLSTVGFELLDVRKAKVVERIKTEIIELIHQSENVEMNTRLSVLLQQKLNLDYHYLSSLFSSVEGVTIEKYMILQKIERAKELLIYGELNISEIADNLGYSSVAHLSNQFKKVTGLTPSHFKQVGQNKRKPLDKI